MSIVGIESIIYCVDDLELSTRFWSDFGLTVLSVDATQSIFQVASGARVLLRRRGDPRLPSKYSDKPGVHETIWGVDTPENMKALVEDLSRDRDVTFDESATAHFLADDGLPLGLRVWNKRAFVSVTDAVNTPAHISRLNQHRQWRSRARPKTINHVVFFSTDYVKSFEFLQNRLGFRYSDHSRGVGVFARADGAYEHHSIFFVNANLPVADGKPGFMHAAFGVDDIDELMIGANYMEKKGWANTSRNSSGGVSRHRISSAIYYYVDCPSGGEAEYHADTDYLDDNWVPRVWDFKFGSLMWAQKVPTIFAGDNIPWDMKFDPEGASLHEKPSSSS